MNKLDKTAIEKLLNDGDQEDWETGELGRDSKHAKAVYIKTTKEVPTSMRIPPWLLTELKELALETGIPYQTYVKMILTRHVKEEKKKKTA